MSGLISHGESRSHTTTVCVCVCARARVCNTPRLDHTQGTLSLLSFAVPFPSPPYPSLPPCSPPLSGYTFVSGPWSSDVAKRLKREGLVPSNLTPPLHARYTPLLALVACRLLAAAP